MTCRTGFQSGLHHLLNSLQHVDMHCTNRIYWTDYVSLSNREVNNRIVNGWWLVLASELGPEVWLKEIFSGLFWCRDCICGYLLYISFIRLSTYLYYCSVSQSDVPNVFRNIGGNVMVSQSNSSLACEYEKALFYTPSIHSWNIEN